MTRSMKPSYKTIKVKYDDGTEVQVKRCSLEDTATLLELQDSLLEAYVKCNGAVGELLYRTDIRDSLTTMCNMLPIVSTKESNEFLDFSRIEENWEQLVLLFFNGSLDEDRELRDASVPGHVSQLHFFGYVRMIQKHVESEKEANEKEKSKKN